MVVEHKLMGTLRKVSGEEQQREAELLLLIHERAEQSGPRPSPRRPDPPDTVLTTSEVFLRPTKENWYSLQDRMSPTSTELRFHL